MMQALIQRMISLISFLVFSARQSCCNKAQQPFRMPIVCLFRTQDFAIQWLNSLLTGIFAVDDLYAGMHVIDNA